MKPFSLSQLADALNVTLSGEQLAFRDIAFTGLCTDSRKVNPGNLFWAIKGPHHDGHNFIQAAIELGAAGVVAERKTPGNNKYLQLIVPDTTTALGKFAHHNKQQSDAIVIGITGSVGKTTTRSLLHHVLSSKYAGCESLKNYNNQWGVPLSLLELNKGRRVRDSGDGGQQNRRYSRIV